MLERPVKETASQHNYKKIKSFNIALHSLNAINTRGRTVNEVIT